MCTGLLIWVEAVSLDEWRWNTGPPAEPLLQYMRINACVFVCAGACVCAACDVSCPSTKHEFILFILSMVNKSSFVTITQFFVLFCFFKKEH